MRYAILGSLVVLAAGCSLPTGPTHPATLTVLVLAEDASSPAPHVKVTLDGGTVQRTDAQGLASWIVETPEDYRVIAEGLDWRYEMAGHVTRDTRWTAIAGK